MQQRVRTLHRGLMPFVCHTTPHFDSTSRGGSYSVRIYITRYATKCKYPISPLGTNSEKIRTMP